VLGGAPAAIGSGGTGRAVGDPAPPWIARWWRTTTSPVPQPAAGLRTGRGGSRRHRPTLRSGTGRYRVPVPPDPGPV